MNKEMFVQLKEKKTLTALVAFCVVALAMILIGVFAIKTPVVALCVLVIIQAGIAVMLHNAELWIHGAMILAEVIAGIIAGRIDLVLLCALVYVAATAALWISDKDE